MTLRALAKLKRYVIAKQDDGEEILFPCCAIYIDGQETEITSKTAVLKREFKDNENVVIEYDTENIEKFIIVDTNDDRPVPIFFLIMFAIMIIYIFMKVGVSFPKPIMPL